MFIESGRTHPFALSLARCTAKCELVVSGRASLRDAELRGRNETAEPSFFMFPLRNIYYIMKYVLWTLTVIFLVLNEMHTLNKT